MSAASSSTAETQSDDAADVVKSLNRFFSEEIAAETAYGMAAERARGGDAALYLGLLRQFQEEHGLAAEAIREQIQELGGEISDSCGTFGAWSSAASATSTFLGTGKGDKNSSSALENLKLGEEHNLNGYQEGIRILDASSAQLLTNLLIPAQRRHVSVLDELLGTSTST